MANHCLVHNINKTLDVFNLYEKKLKPEKRKKNREETIVPWVRIFHCTTERRIFQKPKTGPQTFGTKEKRIIILLITLTGLWVLLLSENAMSSSDTDVSSLIANYTFDKRCSTSSQLSRLQVIN